MKDPGFKEMQNKQWCHGIMAQCPNSPPHLNLPEILENMSQAKLEQDGPIIINNLIQSRLTDVTH